MLPKLFKFWTTFILGCLSILPYNGCSTPTSPVKLTNTDQLVQIGDREPYEAKLTSMTFGHPICILALEIHTLQPLTGAEDIEITHSLCDELNSPNLTWTLTHYTNKKNIFVLRHPILARRLGIIAGFGRGSSSSGLTVLNIDIKECNSEQIFGDPKTEEEEQIKKHCKNHSPVSKEHKHRHKHQHLIKVSDIELDQLLVNEHDLNDRGSSADKGPDSVEAVFVRQKRQTSEVPDSFSP